MNRPHIFDILIRGPLPHQIAKRRLHALFLASTLMAAANLAGAQSASTQAGKSTPKTPVSGPALAGPKPRTANFSAYATPSPITFAATDPDSPTVSGSATTTVSWGVTNTANDPWKLQVAANSATFSNCATAIPVSAVTIACTAGFDGGGTVSCTGATTLSTSNVTMASGTVPGAGFTNFWVTLTYTLTDNWKYIAQTSSSCTLDITYTATVN